jgi:nucleoid-associated protein YgaU
MKEANAVKKGKLPAAALLMLAAAIVSACGCVRPTAELKRAQDAIAQAKQAGAAEYAPAQLDDAEMALMHGREQMDNMSYGEAKSSFEQAYRLAIQARDQAQAGDIFKSGAGQTSDIFKSAGGETETGTAPAQYPLPTTHKVREGETLWLVSEYKDVYADPFQWPLIYDANRARIDQRSKASGLALDQPDGKAHWIFPGQQLDIPRDASTDRIKKARARAGAPTPYPPPGQ